MTIRYSTRLRLLTMLPLLAWSVIPPAPAVAQAAPAAAVRTPFTIPAQPLAAALSAFGLQSGYQVTMSPATTDGLVSHPVNGRFTADQALQQLLEGTGIQYRRTDDRTVVIDRIPTGGGAAGSPVAGATLPPLVVTGTQAPENGRGPVDGYIAHQSTVGTKTDTALIDTPQSVSVVTRDQIRTQNPQTVDQALRYTSGIEPESRGGLEGFDFVYGRGFTLDRYLDGLKLQGASGFIPPSVDIYNLERVEVLRGPDSILYGQASPAGIVNLVTKRPTDTPFHEISLQAGTENNFEGAFDFGGPVNQDGTVLYRITGLGHTLDSDVKYNKTQRLAISPSVTWKPDPDTSFTLLTSYQRDPAVGLYNFVPAAGSVTGNVNGTIPRNLYTGDPDYNHIDRTQASIGYEFSHRFNDLVTVRQNFRYMYDEGNLDQILPVSLAADQRTLNRYVLRDYENLNAVSLDNQAEFNFSTGRFRHTVLGGIDYQHTVFNQEQGQGTGAQPLNIFAPVYNLPFTIPAITTSTGQTQDQVGLYAQDQIRIDRFIFTLGARGDWAMEDTDNRITSKTTSQYDVQPSWRAGVVYKFDMGLAPYVSYSTSFQPTTGTSFNGAAFTPTTGKQYEVGIKYQPPGYNSFITAAAYNLTQQNVLTTDPVHTSFQEQTGEIRSRGIELEAHTNFAPGFNAIATYSYDDPVITKSTTNNLGEMPLYVPRHLASFWTDYVFQEGSGKLAGLGLGGGVRYVGSTFGSADNSLKVPAFTLVDASVSYDLAFLGYAYRGWKVAVNATNLFDKKYVSECSNVTYCLYGLRRTVLANLKYDW